MLLIFLSFIIIAISLPYFSLNSIKSKEIWKRISFLCFFISILLYIESLTLDINTTIFLYNGLFNHTQQNSMFIGLILLTSLILNTIGSFSSNTNLSQLSLDTRDRERLVFVFSLIIGGIILSGASDFLTVFLGLELQSYSAYILAASYRNYEPSEAAGLKYFLLGALSSALIFMGLALLYVYSGNTQIDLSFSILSAEGYNGNDAINTMIPYIGVILIFLGFSWKIAAAPLQAWSIDVYDAVPTKTTALLSLLPKIGLISFLTKIIFDIISLINFSYSGNGYELNILDLSYIIYIVIGLSLLIGSIYGIFQPRIKRLLAYSSVLNIGFILMGTLLINFGQLDNFNPLFYLIQYVITTATIWLGLTNIEKISGIELTLNSQLQGIANNNSYASKESKGTKYIAVSLTILILSTAGIPPMVGFFAKYEVILLALKTEYFSLAILAILASLFSTYYYLNVLKNIWFKTSMWSNDKLLSLSNQTILEYNGLYLFRGNSTFICLLTISILLFVLQYSVIYIFLTLTF